MIVEQSFLSSIPPHPSLEMLIELKVLMSNSSLCRLVSFCNSWLIISSFLCIIAGKKQKLPEEDVGGSFIQILKELMPSVPKRYFLIHLESGGLYLAFLWYLSSYIIGLLEFKMC